MASYQYQNPFTYKSSAGPVQATPSFQDMLDDARTKMTETIAKQQAATPAPSTPGLSDARNYGGDNGGGDRAGSTGASEGRGSTLGSHNSTLGGDFGTAGKAVGAAIGTALGIGPSIGAAIGGKIGGGMRGEGDYNGYGQLGNNGLGVAGDEATGPGTIGSRDTYGSNESPSGIGADGFGGGGFGGLGGGTGIGADGNTGNAAEGGPSGPGGDGSGGDNSGANGGDNSGGGGATGGDRGDSGFAKGGKIGLKDVRHFTAGGPNRPGVDDGLVPSSVGDFILTAERTRQIGAAALKALTEGRAEIVMLKGKK